jgi:hypothetical protein
MNRKDDIELVLEHWLDDGPRHMPDRLFERTFERIDALPRRRLVDLGLRLPTMHLNVRIALVAALFAALAGAGLIALGGAAPAPRPSLTPTVPPVSVLQSLDGRWDSDGVRLIPNTGSSYGMDFTITPNRLDLDVYPYGLASSIAAAPDGSLHLDLLDPGAQSAGNKHWKCSTGDQGEYRIAVSADGNTLTLTPTHDPCLTRSAVLVGAWTRWPCAPTAPSCPSDLAPGRHVALHFEPFNTQAGVPSSGSLSYVVPAGWAVPYVVPSWPNEESYSLFQLERPVDDIAPINVVANTQPHTERQTGNNFSPRCTGDDTAVGDTPQQIGAWLQTIPGIVVTRPAPITVGGLTGVMLDVSAVPGYAVHCVSADAGDSVITFQGSMTVDPGTSHRYILLDTGSHATLLIEIWARSDTFDALIAEAMPVIQTFEFNR